MHHLLSLVDALALELIDMPIYQVENVLSIGNVLQQVFSETSQIRITRTDSYHRGKSPFKKACVWQR
jgi:hypothetical protein